MHPRFYIFTERASVSSVNRTSGLGRIAEIQPSYDFLDYPIVRRLFRSLSSPLKFSRHVWTRHVSTRVSCYTSAKLVFESKIREYIRVYTHTHAHGYIYIHIHTYIHIHAYASTCYRCHYSLMCFTARDQFNAKVYYKKQWYYLEVIFGVR